MRRKKWIDLLKRKCYCFADFLFFGGITLGHDPAFETLCLCLTLEWPSKFTYNIKSEGISKYRKNKQWLFKMFINILNFNNTEETERKTFFFKHYGQGKWLSFVPHTLELFTLNYDSMGFGIWQWKYSLFKLNIQSLTFLNEREIFLRCLNIKLKRLENNLIRSFVEKLRHCECNGFINIIYLVWI